MGVKIRQKRNKLYLDIHYNGKRTTQALYLTITENKAHNREAMKIAEIARAEKERQLFRQSWGLQDDLSAKKPLYQYKMCIRDRLKDLAAKEPPKEFERIEKELYKI